MRNAVHKMHFSRATSYGAVDAVIDMNHAIRQFSILIVALMLLSIWKLVFASTSSPADHAFLLSPGYSIFVHGEFLDSRFAHPAFQPYVFPYLYSALVYPILSFVSDPILVPFVVSIFFLVILIAVIQRSFAASNVPFSLFAVVSVVLFSNPYLWAGRTEIVALICYILILVVLRSAAGITWRHILLISICITASGLLHPISGVFGCVFAAVVFVEKYGLSQGIRYYFRCLLTTLVLVLVTYGPVAIADTTHFVDSYSRFIEGQPRSANFSKFLEYFVISPWLMLLYAATLIRVLTRMRNTREMIRFLMTEFLIFSPLALLLILQGTSYYVTLLQAVFLWRISTYGRDRIWPILTITIVLICPIFTHYLPTIQRLENPSFFVNYSRALGEVEGSISGDNSEENRYWVSLDLAMLGIDRANTHLYSNLVLKYFAKPELRVGDVVYFTRFSEEIWLRRFLNNEVAHARLEEVIPPSLGLVTLPSLFRERSEGIGLWKATIQRKDQ